MNLNKLILVNNECYKVGQKMTPKGFMLHSTGAKNPWLKRYVGPDDGKLGTNTNNNHWNQFRPDERQVCVHGFIGKLADGTVATYQTLPWDYVGWHCAGTGNGYLIGVEICEDDLKDSTYFNKVYKEAVELAAFLAKMFNWKINENTVLCHSEGAKKGIASNHSDVMHWFPKHGKSMDTFRADVQALLKNGSAPTLTPTPTPTQKPDVIYQTYTNGRWQPNVKNKDDYAGVYGLAISGVYANLSEGNITYKVHTKGGKWLPEVVNRKDYAGLLGKSIDGLMMKSSKGTAKYRVHIKNGSWLPWVTGYNEKDSNNGYAGILNKEIDGIQVEII